MIADSHSRLLRVALLRGALILALLGVGIRPASAGGLLMVKDWIQRRLDRPVGPVFKPSNVYRASESLPADVRRVALLPLVGSRADSTFSSGLDCLEPILGRELGKQGAFEVVRVPPELLRRWIGKSSLKAEDPIPEGLLEKIRERYACQAVIFAQLTQFHAFSPVQIGWSFRMVDSRHAETFWAAEEVFDAGVPSVANAARRFTQDYQYEPSSISDSTFMLSSPRGFGQYTLHALLTTLPSR